jgi:hypothetical protein
MAIDESLLEVRTYGGEGYMPLIDYGEWRVAVLRHADELLPQNIDNMQRHDETDEVFVLLEGRCILFIGEGQEAVTTIHAQDMQPLKLYNVKVGCWHTHTLSEDATVLVVENRDTTLENSPSVPLNASQRAKLTDLTRDLWGVS